MIIKFWFENSKSNEAEVTKLLIKLVGAFERMIDKSPSEYIEYSGNMGVDTHKELLNVVRLMLFYNDRTDVEIERIIGDLDVSMTVNNSANKDTDI